MPNAAAAEDLVQETLLLAWRGFRQFQRGSNVRAWLFRILLNCSSSQGRKQRSAPPTVSFSAAGTEELLEAQRPRTRAARQWEQPLTFGGALKTEPVLRGSSMPQIAFADIELQDVVRALDALHVEHRTVLLLSVVEGFTGREMAEILSVPIGTVMSRLNRARHALRTQLISLTHFAGKAVR